VRDLVLRRARAAAISLAAIVVALASAPALVIMTHLAPPKQLNIAAAVGSFVVLAVFAVALHQRAEEHGRRTSSWSQRFLHELHAWNGVLDEETEDALRRGNLPRF
jgi:hypothetical protein